MGFADWLARVFGLRQPPPAPRAAPPPVPQGQWPAPRPAPPSPVPQGRWPSAAAPDAPPSPPAAPPRPPVSAQFRLDRFRPISREELARNAGTLNVGWDPWRWRRDDIPPPDDPRTALIDRAMVAEGLLTAEDLARMHEVGEQHRLYSKDIHDLHLRARGEMAASEQERAARKAQKQAEAAARREAHARAVAERRATDIVFLGRGVSKGLADRRAEVEKLQAAHLPVLATPADVARFLEVPIPRLRWLAFHSEASAVCHYVHFAVAKKSGGERRLSAPHRDLARCQRLIFEKIIGGLPVHAAAHGFVRGRNVVSNAQPHAGAAIVVNLDLQDFFPSIGFARVRGLFAALGYSPAAATILALLCTESPREAVTLSGQRLWVAAGPRALPQGACTSPALANLAARVLDARLAGLATAWGWTYTRYADDLTFSSRAAEADIGRLLTAVRNIVGDEGLRANEAKTRVLRAHQAQEVTGLVVNQRPKVPRATIRRLRAILHRAKHEGLAAQNREGHHDFDGWVRGMIAWVAVSDRTAAAKLRAAYDALP